MKNKDTHFSSEKEELLSKVVLPERSEKPTSNNFEAYVSPRLFIDKQRFTYTFLHEGEMASLHYDARRSEIFYKGHNIRNLNLTKLQINMFGKMTELLCNAGADVLAKSYQDCLCKILNA